MSPKMRPSVHYALMAMAMPFIGASVARLFAGPDQSRPEKLAALLGGAVGGAIVGLGLWLGDWLKNRA
jgi:hypothetical protein